MAELGISYADALRALGHRYDGWIGQVLSVARTGLVPLGGAPAVDFALQFTTEVEPFLRNTVETIAKRASHERIPSRLEAVEAAHAALTVDAFFKAVARTLPRETKATKSSKRERRAIVAMGPADPRQGVVDELGTEAVGVRISCPAFNLSLADNLQDNIRPYYKALATRWIRFLQGLSATQGFMPSSAEDEVTLIHELVNAAVDDYFGNIATYGSAVPEFSIWLALSETSSLGIRLQEMRENVMADLKAQSLSLISLHEALTRVQFGDQPVTSRLSQALGSVNRSALAEPIIDVSEQDLYVPTIEQGYIDAPFQVLERGPRASTLDDSWWEGLRDRRDFGLWFASFCLSAEATTSPLLILGQPGSGKSLLTRVLAARLPASDFAAVRVQLRDVTAVSEMHLQIEASLESLLHERYTWQQFNEDHALKMRVVLFDGLDELMQATSHNHEDYLLRVEEFQRREAILGRPVVVIVTSRTTMAARVSVPPNTKLLKLNAFSTGDVIKWLAAWQSLDANVRNCRLQSLEVGTFMIHDSLAKQPLLLALTLIHLCADGEMSHAQRGDVTLFLENLISGFLLREAAREPDRCQGAKSRRLSLESCAFSMFSRGVQVLEEATIESDMAITVPEGHRLSIVDLIRGFYFLQRNSARLGKGEIRSYEFLHATIGEFLTASHIWRRLTTVDTSAVVGMQSAYKAGLLDLLDDTLGWSVFAGRETVLAHLRSFIRNAHRHEVDRATETLIFRIGLFGETLAVGGANARRPDLPPTARTATVLANAATLVACGLAPKGSDVRGLVADNSSATWTALARLMVAGLAGDELAALVTQVTLDQGTLELVSVENHPVAGSLEYLSSRLTGDALEIARQSLFSTVTQNAPLTRPEEVRFYEFLLGPHCNDQDVRVATMSWIGFLEHQIRSDADRMSVLAPTLWSLVSKKAHITPFVLIASLALIAMWSGGGTADQVSALLEKTLRFEGRNSLTVMPHDRAVLSRLTPEARAFLLDLCGDLPARMAPSEWLPLSPMQKARFLVGVTLADVGGDESRDGPMFASQRHHITTAASEAEKSEPMIHGGEELAKAVLKIVRGEESRQAVCEEFNVGLNELSRLVDIFIQAGSRGVTSERSQAEGKSPQGQGRPSPPA